LGARWRQDQWSRYLGWSSTRTSTCLLRPRSASRSRPLKAPALPRQRCRAPPSVEALPHPDQRAPSSRPRHPGRTRPVAPVLLGGGRLHGLPPLLDDGSGSQQGWCRWLLHGGGHDQPFLDLHRQRLDIQWLGMGLRGNNMRTQHQALQRREAEDTGVDVSTRRRNQLSKQNKLKSSR
jgi:hypothetical protein